MYRVKKVIGIHVRKRTTRREGNDPWKRKKEKYPKVDFLGIQAVKLKGVELPTFSGDDKTEYESWKAAYLSVVDGASISVEDKMLRLQGCLTGKALKIVKDLGYSENAYKRAIEKLDKKFGGERRLV